MKAPEEPNINSHEMAKRKSSVGATCSICISYSVKNNGLKNYKKTPFWEISKPGCQPTYIIGTMHVRDDRAFTYQSMVEEKILACDAFAAEYALDQSEGLGNHHLMNENGLSIYDLVTLRKGEKFKQKINKYYHLDLDQFQFFKPLVISNFLSESILQTNNVHSLDYQFWKYADANGKEMKGVEEFEDQMTTMSLIPMDYQLKSLSHMINNPKSFKKSILNLMDNYQKGEIQQLYKSSKKSLGKIKKLLLYSRNQIMATNIAQLSTESSIVCAIGVGHLAGKQGVLKLLKDDGYVLTPLRIGVDVV